MKWMLPLTRQHFALAISPKGRGETAFSRREKVPEGRMRGPRCLCQRRQQGLGNTAAKGLRSKPLTYDSEGVAA